jgi:hypothetical protein
VTYSASSEAKNATAAGTTGLSPVIVPAIPFYFNKFGQSLLVPRQSLAIAKN